MLLFFISFEKDQIKTSTVAKNTHTDKLEKGGKEREVEKVEQSSIGGRRATTINYCTKKQHKSTDRWLKNNKTNKKWAGRTLGKTGRNFQLNIPCIMENMSTVSQYI